MNKQILWIIESISNEKLLNKDIIFDILEKTLEISIKKNNYKNFNIKVKFDRITGDFFIFKLFKIVNEINDKNIEISINNSIVKKLNLNINDYLEEKIENFNFSRINSKIAKQILFNKIKIIEKESLKKYFHKFIGKIFLGIIKKICKNKIIFDIGYEFEAILNKNHMLYNDKYIIEKKLKIILYNTIYDEEYGFQLLVSRSHIYMLVKLLKINIYEINNNILNIIYIVRNPGIRSKIIVKKNKNIYNKSLFINKINLKLNEISNILNGEKIDIILWNKNIIKFVKNIIYPIKFKYIKFNKDNNIINVLIKKSNIKYILGINNTNIKLINKLTNKFIKFNTY